MSANDPKRTLTAAHNAVPEIASGLFKGLVERVRCCLLGLGAEMRRREFLAVIGGAAVLWPLAVRAQQGATPVIGFLSGQSPDAFARYADAFRQGLKATGYVDGENIAIEYRWAQGQNDRLPDMAADLVRRQVAVIAATGGVASALAAKAATTTIPTVVTSGDDPIKSGLVSNLNRPGGNITVVNFFSTETVGKRLALLRDLVPAATSLAALMNPNSPEMRTQLPDVQAAAAAIGPTAHHLQC